MFRTLICPSSGVYDYVVELTYWLISFCKNGGISFNVNLWCLVVCIWCDVCCRTICLDINTLIYRVIEKDGRDLKPL